MENAVVWKSIDVVEAEIDGAAVPLRSSAHNVVNVARRSRGGHTAWDATLVLADDEYPAPADRETIELRVIDPDGREFRGAAILTRVMRPVLQLLGSDELEGFDWAIPSRHEGAV